MPASISYDHPSLVLGNIIDTRMLDLLNKSGGLQAKITLAREKMNSFVMMKRSLAMTINELTDMNVDVSDLKTKVKEMDTSITQAATDYMNVRMQSETSIQQLMQQLYELESVGNPESPVDFSRSAIKRLPLSSESLQLDAQYFSFGSNQQDDTMANIEKYVRDSTANLGSRSDDMAKTASAQIDRQKQNHNLAGTLIITASCSHRNVTLIEPFTIDADKAISVWNSVYSQDKINTSDPVELKKQLEGGTQTQAEQSLAVLSGAAYGSGFVGMVHIVKNDANESGPTDAIVSQLQEKLKMGGWLQNVSGGFGIDESVKQEVKKLLSTQTVSSHISVISMGAVPSIASNQLSLGISKVLQPDAEKMNGYLLALEQPSIVTESVDAAADAAKTGSMLLNMQTSTIQSVMRGLGDIDHGSNQVLDINSLMSTFENYIKCIKEKEESTGVPVKFYVKNISKNQLAQLWLEKYYPDKNGATAPTNGVQAQAKQPA